MTEDIPNDTLLFSRLWIFLTVKLFYYFQEMKLSFLLVRYSTILWRIYQGLFEWYSTIFGGVIEDILNDTLPFSGDTTEDMVMHYSPEKRSGTLPAGNLFVLIHIQCKLRISLFR